MAMLEQSFEQQSDDGNVVDAHIEEVRAGLSVQESVDEQLEDSCEEASADAEAVDCEEPCGPSRKY